MYYSIGCRFFVYFGYDFTNLFLNRKREPKKIKEVWLCVGEGASVGERDLELGVFGMEMVLKTV